MLIYTNLCCYKLSNIFWSILFKVNNGRKLRFHFSNIINYHALRVSSSLIWFSIWLVGIFYSLPSSRASVVVFLRLSKIEKSIFISQCQVISGIIMINSHKTNKICYDKNRSKRNSRIEERGMRRLSEKLSNLRSSSCFPMFNCCFLRKKNFSLKKSFHRWSLSWVFLWLFILYL